VLNARVPAPSTVSNASACLDVVVSRTLQFKPDERYSTALEFAQALEQSGIAIAPPPCKLRNCTTRQLHRRKGLCDRVR
jgi:hypothetical protein